MIRIADAGNVDVPAYLTLKERGYTVTCTYSEDGEVWTATSGDCELIAECPVTLLGLAALYETRGQEWKASDDEIEGFLKLFDLGTPEVLAISRGRVTSGTRRAPSSEG